VKGELDVVHVNTSDAGREADQKALDDLRQLADNLGARWHEMSSHDPAAALTEFARSHQITQLVIGSSQRSRWQELRGGGSIVRRVIREAGAVGIDVHVIARRELLPAETGTAGADE
jgi:two-component system, OmpR family, sensor histidine kinase KdpD